MASQSKTQQNRAVVLRAIGEPELLDLVSNGWSHRRIAARVTEITGKPISCYYITKCLQSLEGYPEAKKANAEYHAGKVADAAEAVANGTLDPASARVASENHKWLASKMDPSVYSDKVAVDMQIVDLTRVHLDSLRDRLRTVSNQ
jgi:hypothetical protein